MKAFNKPKYQSKDNSNHRKLTFCIFLGQEGSGKSTLISHLCEAQLSFAKQGLKYHISHNENNCPQINNDRKARRKSSHICLTKNGNILYEPQQNVKFIRPNLEEKENNTLCNDLFKVGGSMKIIIVIDNPSLMSKKADPFIRITQRLKQMFGEDFETSLLSCVLVVTKINIVYSLSDITEHISDIAYSLKGNKSAKLLMKTLLKQRKIVLYYTPERANKYIETIRQKITSPNNMTTYGQQTIDESGISRASNETFDQSDKSINSFQSHGFESQHD